MNRTLILLSLCLSLTAYAQAFDDGYTFTPTSSDHAEQALTAVSITTSGALGIKLTSQTSLGTCTTPNYYSQKFITSTGYLYVCTPDGWHRVYTSRDGVLPAADLDVPAHTFVAQNEEDGFGFRFINDGCGDFGAGTSDEICAVGNEIYLRATTHLPTTFVQALASETPTAPLRYISQSWFGWYPIASHDTCGADDKGGVDVLSGDGRAYLCDGTSVQKLAVVLSATASVNFESITNATEGTATLTLTGAVSGQSVHCNPTGALESGLVKSYEYVSAADTITIVEYNGSAALIDPAAVNFNCTITF
jgi:hypothetical protein